MQQADLIISPRWVIPMDEAGTLLENVSVVVREGRIVEVTANPGERYACDNEVKLAHHVLIPGFVNAHTHAAMSLFRGYADDIPLREWLTDHIWPAEQKWVDPEFVRAGTRLAIAEMIRGGITCFNDMYFCPDVVAQCAEQAGMRACVGMIVIDFPTIWANDAEEYISKGLELRDAIRHSSLVTTAFAPHAPYTVSDEPLEKIATLANELDCRVHTHLHETAHEVEESMARFGVRPMERLERLGLLGPNLQAVHMTQLLPGEIESVAERGIHVIHCVESNLKLASGFCPVHQLNQAGVNVSFATDSASSNNDLDMIGEMRTAALLAKAVAGDPTAQPAMDTLRACTLNPARAMGLDAEIGSISAGKSADLTAIDLSGITTEPVFNPVSQVVYSATRDQVSHVWIAGAAKLRERELVDLDPEELLQQAREWRARMARDH